MCGLGQLKAEPRQSALLCHSLPLRLAVVGKNSTSRLDQHVSLVRLVGEVVLGGSTYTFDT